MTVDTGEYALIPMVTVFSMPSPSQNLFLLFWLACSKVNKNVVEKNSMIKYKNKMSKVSALQ